MDGESVILKIIALSLGVFDMLLVTLTLEILIGQRQRRQHPPNPCLLGLRGLLR